MARGRKELDNTDVFLMFGIQYSGPGAFPPFQDDASLSAKQKFDLHFHKSWLSLAVSSRKLYMTPLRRWQIWIDSQPGLAFGYIVHPSSKVAAFLKALLADLIGGGYKNPAGSIKTARKALRHLATVQRVPLEDDQPLPKQPLVAGVQSLAREATTEARRGDDVDPSCAASLLSSTEKAAILDAAMRFPDTTVGLCVAAMVSVALVTGFRSDDLCDCRYFFELMPTVASSPWPMQVLGISSNGGKANQEGLITYCGLASHKNPLSDAMSYLGQWVVYQLLNGLPILHLIAEGNVVWRQFHVFLRDPASALEKQSYYDLASQLTRVIESLKEPLLKRKLMHLMRNTGLIDLAANAVPIDVLKIWGRWFRADGSVGVSYLPKSPLSALPAIAVLCGFSADYMTEHSLGRGLVAVPVLWIDSLAPGAREAFRLVRSRNRSGSGKGDFSGENAAASILHLAELVWQSSPFMLQRYGLRWWPLQIPSLRAIVGSAEYRVFEQEVIASELECSAHPRSPEFTREFSELRLQVTSISEQLSQLQRSVDSLSRPAVASAVGSVEDSPDLSLEPPAKQPQLAADEGPRLPVLDAGVGLSAGLTTVQQAVQEWFFGFAGFPAPETMRKRVILRGQRVSKKCSDQLSKRRHLPLRIQALAKDRLWPLSRATAVFTLVAERHELTLAEVRNGVRLSAPVRNPRGRSGPRPSSKFLCRGAKKSPISVADFASWVLQATNDVAESTAVFS